MDGLLAVMAVLGFISAWHLWQYRSSDGRTWSPLWGAFTFTSVAILFVVAGALGYKITHGVPFANPEEWTGHVIWSQIAVGVVAALLAAWLWRLGLQSIRKSL